MWRRSAALPSSPVQGSRQARLPQLAGTAPALLQMLSGGSCLRSAEALQEGGLQSPMNSKKKSRFQGFTHAAWDKVRVDAEARN